MEIQEHYNQFWKKLIKPKSFQVDQNSLTDSMENL